MTEPVGAGGRSDGLGADRLGAENLDTRILRSVGWVMLSRAGGAVVTTAALVVLARLLEPEAFGLVALASALLAVLQLLQTSGLGAALIYRRHGVEEAAGSVLVYSTAGAVLLFVGMLVASPWIAQAFGQPEATNVIRALAFILVIRGIGVAPTAVLERGMNFWARTIGDMGSVVCQAAVSIPLAFAGFGVWSLVAGSLTAGAVQTAVSWFLAPIHPSPRHARWSAIRELLRYGRHVTAGNVVTLATRTLDNLVVARVLGAAALGVYALAFRLANMPANLFVGVVGRVMFPAYAILQDDKPAFRRAYIQNLQRVALLALPVGVFLSVGAEPVVTALLGPKWLEAIEPLRLLALYALVRSLISPCGAVYQAAGKPYLVPLLALPQLVVMVPALIVLTRRYEATGAALAMLISVLASAVPALAAAMRLLELRVAEFVRSLAPAFLCSGLLAVTLAVLLEPSEGLPPVARLGLLVLAGGLVYITSAAIFARETISRVWLGLRGAPSAQPEPGA